MLIEGATTVADLLYSVALRSWYCKRSIPKWWLRMKAYLRVLQSRRSHEQSRGLVTLQKSFPTMTSICHTGKSGDFSRVMPSSFCYFHDCVSWANCMWKTSLVCSSLKTPWQSNQTSQSQCGVSILSATFVLKKKKAWNIEILLEFYPTRNVNSKAVCVLYMRQ